jgi:hypothetical protein
VTTPYKYKKKMPDNRYILSAQPVARRPLPSPAQLSTGYPQFPPPFELSTGYPQFPANFRKSLASFPLKTR